MVVAIHSQPFIYSFNMDYWITSICRIGVPFFFVVGSYFFFKSNKPIWSYIKRLWILYLVWFIIELPIIYERFFIGYPFYKGFAFFVRGLLVNNTFYASWYITASWQATLIIYLLARRSKVLLFIIGILCAFLSVSNAMYAHLFDNIIWNRLISITSMCFASNSFITAIPFCIIGRHIALNEDRIMKQLSWVKLAFIPVIVLAAIEVYSCKQYFAITDAFWSLYPISFILIILLISYSVPISDEMSRAFRSMSILIYLTHGIVMRLIKGVTDINQGMTLFLTTTLICIVISIIIYKFSSKIHFLKYLY